MPITNAMRLLLRKNLRANLHTLAELQHAKKGAKLRFEPETGLFKHDNFQLVRALRNTDSVTNEDMFHDPILVTMYECKKLCLNPTVNGLLQATEHLGDPPAVAFQNALMGLNSLLDAYPLHVDPTNSKWDANADRKALNTVITCAGLLRDARERDDLDGLIKRWVRGIVLPLPRLPNDMPLAVVTAAIDNHIRDLIYNRLRSPDQEKRHPAQLALEIREDIYHLVYATGGYPAALVLPQLDQAGYTAAVTAVGAKLHKYNVKVEPNKDNFFHISCPKMQGWAAARVYIHLQADPNGEHAVRALDVLCNLLTIPGSIDRGNAP
jgi:hypothetical protein